MKNAALFVVATALCAGCQTPNPPATEAQTAATPDAPVAPAKLAELTKEDAQKSICGSVKGPCTVTDFKAAGDATKQLYVAEVAFLEKPESGWKEPNHDLENQCNPWALYAMNAATPATPVVIGRFCNEGYGASGIGEDFWEVKDGRVSLSQTGGSNWRWSESKTIDLTSNTLVQKGSDNYFATNPNAGEQQSWDFAKFVVTSAWSVWPCGSDEDSSKEFRALSIPRTTLPKAFTGGGWKTTGTHTCATALDATAGVGFVTHGEKSTAADTSMKVVADGNTVFVEVTDDTLVASATGKWIHGDHLEVWASPEEPIKMEMSCVDLTTKGKAWQWGIDALSGTVQEAYGKPSAKLTAERAAFAGGVRFKVTLPAEAKSVTVIYSDSDDGQKQERLLSTSDFKFATVQTMGNIVDLDAKYATCKEDGGVLVKTITPMGPVEDLP